MDKKRNNQERVPRLGLLGKMFTKWDGMKRLRKGSDLPEGILREEDIKLHARLDMINEMAMELSTIPITDDIYRPIVDWVREITGAKVCSVSRYYPEKKQIELKGISARGKVLKIAGSLLKGSIIGTRMNVEEEIHERMIHDEGGYSDDLHEASLRTIPRSVSSTLQRMAGLKGFTGIALKYGDELLGTMMIMQGKEDPPVNLKLMQVIANVCSIILRRRNIEHDLLRAEARYKDLFETSRDAIFISTPEGKALDFNPALEELLGYEREEIMMMDLSRLYSIPEGRRAFLDKIEKNGFVKDHSTVFVRKEGELIDCLITANIKVTSDRKKVYQGIIRDISEQRKAQMALLAERNRAELYFDLLGHDIGNIHQGLLGTLFLARKGEREPEKMERALESSEKLLKRSINLVSNVRLMSNLRTSEAQPDWVDVIPVIRETMEEMKGLFGGRDMETVIESETDIAEVYTEPMVKEIFFNIFHNAVKVQSEGKVYLGVTIRPSEEREGYIEINIDDKGPGIPDYLKEKLLLPTAIDMRKYRTGLGLSIVNSLVKRYMGEIRISDRVEGKPHRGARFIVILPGRKAENISFG